jgi:hypothetical protein
MNRKAADSVAQAVYARWCEALDEARDHRKLDALAYSECSHEKWLVFETYWRVWRAANQIVELMQLDEGQEWDFWMEAPFPGLPCSRERLDMAFGPSGISETDKKYPPPLSDTPVFEAKILSTIDWRDGVTSVKADVDRAVQAGLKHAYIFILYFMFLNHGPRFASCSDACEYYSNRFSSQVSGIEPIGTKEDFPDWGPYSPDLKRAGGFETARGRYCFFSQAAHVITLPVSAQFDKGGWKGVSGHSE